jgi:NADPH:quinone reductase-like Zn-dependent oxidoreductase
MAQKPAYCVCVLIWGGRFPYKIGYDAAGVVNEVGSSVTSFKAGDEVYVRLPETNRGMCGAI